MNAQSQVSNHAVNGEGVDTLAKHAPIPVDPDLSPRARALFDALHRHSGEFAMVGHQDETFCVHDDGHDSDVLAVTDDYPAVWGFDLGRIELGWNRNIDRIPFVDIRQQMRRAYDMGAVVTVSWHSVNPITERGYGENMALGSVTAVLPGGRSHDKYCEWLDRVADFLVSVTDEDGMPIPVVFRPYHEHTGTWFWWCPGSSMETTDTSSDDYAALWRMTVEYLRDVRGLHNLLYAYSPDRSRIDMSSTASREHDYLFGYPGDAYVDVLGLDDYWDIDQDLAVTSPADRHRDLTTMLTMVGGMSRERGKLAAATEIGSPREFAAAFADDSSRPWTGYLLSAATCNEDARRVLWYLPWRNSEEAVGTGAYGTPAVGSPYAADFRDFARDGFMRLAGEVPPMYE
ncbi:glycosyl hydrolase [Bifidobacterium eulemuris]|uniref:Beta-mannosidase n=1 Tax=Bifidobacterium eulemuris TaxID=1765219 RepID=A0A261GBH2_9BIFI|nr:glycosyl hydrolase [Bifidobacterium eulemuris]OZG68593.1 beta-mannosidase [Bifidobacterium eulemuris]QOL32719.1 beta-mannosidase [Bifidobacterium eulemuris]